MIQDFFPTTPKDQLGSYAGVLASSFHLGGMSGAYIWGKVSDTYGRRKAMLTGIMGTFVSITLFGFSRNFWWSCLTRFSWGLLNGNIGIAKSYLSEVCDDSNMARGFSIIGIATGIGRLVAPMSGALLARPAVEYPSVFSGTFLEIFPYLLPCALGGAVSLCSFILAFKHLEETLQKPHDESKEPLSTEIISNSTDNNLASHSGDEDFDDPVVQSRNLSWKLLKNREIFLTTMLYCLMAMIAIVNSEIFPLWVLNDKAHGGFSFKQQQIGIVILFSAPFQILSQSILFPYLSNRLGYKRVVMQSATVLFFTLNISTFLSYLSPDPLVSYNNITTIHKHCSHFNHHNGTIDVNCELRNQTISQIIYTPLPLPWFTWLAIVTTYSVNAVWNVLGFTAVMVLINNSCFSGARGTVNGIAQTMASTARAIGPVLGGTLFAWSQASGLPWPFDLHLVWNLLICGVILVYYWSSQLPDSINTKKKERTSADPVAT